MRALAKNLLVISALVAVVIYFAHIFPAMEKGLDFPHLYAAARMVHDGRGRDLYDLQAQNQYLSRYAGRIGIYFNHPPFETLIYLPFAVLSLTRAYTLWSAFQAILLIAVARSLEARAVLRAMTWKGLVPILLLFAPLLLDFLQGQDSLLLLLLLTAALGALEQKREFAAGCLLGCGLFKFHLAIPAALPFLLLMPKKLARGFASVAMALVLISVWISGWDAIAGYPRFLLHFDSMPLAGIRTVQKANLRGLLELLLPGSRNAAWFLTLLGSALLILLTLRSCALALRHAGNVRLAFANAVFAAALVGYHLSPHDLTILLLPMILLADHLVTSRDVSRGTRWVSIVTLGILFLPPLHLWLLQVHRYAYACLPILVLFGATNAEIWRTSGRSLDWQVAADAHGSRPSGRV